MIGKRMLQLLVYFSTTALKDNAGFMLKVLENILMSWPNQEADYRAFNDAIRDFQSESMVELQRLAAEVPDHLLVRKKSGLAGNVLIAYITQEVYDQIEARVNAMLESGTLDEKRSLAYRSFLFLIM